MHVSLNCPRSLDNKQHCAIVVPSIASNYTLLYIFFHGKCNFIGKVWSQPRQSSSFFLLRCNVYRKNNVVDNNFKFSWMKNELNSNMRSSNISLSWGHNCIVAANCKLRRMSSDDNFHDLLKRERFMIKWCLSVG